jgi:hypothetical protein
MLTAEQRQEAFREQLTACAILWADSIEGVDPVKAGDVVAASFDRFVAESRSAQQPDETKTELPF